jgi:uncharacterized protein
MQHVALTQLNIFPIKSCGGIALEQARTTEWGLEHDRSWMLVDARGTFLTQRKYPRMALIQPAIADPVLEIRAPGMSALQVPLAPEEYTHGVIPSVVVWRHQLPALDAGQDAAAWFSEFLQMPVRLVRFDPKVRRVCDRAWTAQIEAVTQFSDGFPILVLSEASLEGLNARLQQRGRAAVPMLRFRPNVVVSGLDVHEEDRIDRLEFTAVGVTLDLVKPCTRCVLTTVDPSTGTRDAHWPTEPLETLRDYRIDPTLNGVTFGQNALVTAGVGAVLEVGQAAEVRRR